ncbi:MAG: hypothetical protein IMZ65_00750 [Planctomycetes bacterium]|nr:hypothetical protein [Planctomycetota bacterium]
MTRTLAILCAAILAAMATASTAYAAALAATPAAPAAERPAPKPEPRLGTNLSGPADWNTELPFVDAFRMSRPWISQKKGAGWGKGPELALDARGWVTRLEPDCFAETPLCTIEKGHYPSGDYTVLYDGEGTIEFNSPAKIVSREAGKIVVTIDSSRGGFFLKLAASNPQNYVRNIRVIMPGFAETYRQNPFHPVFLKRWQGMACLRFMDWMETNGSKIAKWSDRPTPEDATFSSRGVALEWMIDLSNRLQADPWFCMPHLADDDYVRQFAKMVKERLDPKRKVYIEYSNEVWNGMFLQSRWAGEEGKKRGFAEKPWEAAWKFTGYRSVQIFKIWEEVFGGRERLVRVLPSQGANAYVSRQVVEFQEAWKQADALAIAPYITCNVPMEGKGLTAAEVEKWTVDQALDFMETKALPESTRWIKEQKRVADQYGLKLVVYEGGQHMVGVGGGENNEAMTRLFHAANAHKRMGDIYRLHLEAWTKEGGDLFCNFSSVSQWSKWGSWGVMPFYDDDPAKYPKFMALLRWGKQCGQPVNVPE